MTSVGGTHLSTDEQGRWLAEYAWVDSPLSQGTSGECRLCTTARNGSARCRWRDTDHRRLAPDVAAVADPLSGVRIVYNQQSLVGAGNLSIRPIWAALTVLMNQYLTAHGGRPLGNLNAAAVSRRGGREPARVPRREPWRERSRYRTARI